MKRFITILALTITTLIVKGDPGNSDLKLKLFNSSPFTVMLDQVHYPAPQKEYNISNITPGRHYISIYKIKYNHFGYPVLVYSGPVDIPAASLISIVARPHALDVVDIVALCPVVQPCHNNVIGMHPEQFRELKDIIEHKSFDSSRLAIAKQAVATNGMTSRQVSEIMDLFSFESSKLEFAKCAYRTVVDPDRYYLTYESLTFSSSVEELIDFMDRG